MTRSRAPPTPEQLALEAQSTANLAAFYSTQLQAVQETGCWPPDFNKSEKHALLKAGLVVSAPGHKRRHGHLTLTPRALTVLLTDE